ncbi:ficolin-1-like [Mercenaria mercenaria]|uniref:ficolin-1-like n=1 Tax=Mercenaria mercenaria TaxID=6596 RepID=UPI00234EC24A|nr:ficolin-1-like [Mercenaria mercenaria]
MAGVCGQRPCLATEKCVPDKDGFHCSTVCESVPTIDNGFVALDKAGKMSFMDTATVKCHDTYGPDKPSIKCQASGLWETVSCEKITDCKDLHRSFPSLPSGVYEVELWRSSRSLPVYCDMDTGGGGWTVFQSRFDGSVEFYKTFSDYEYGFGNLETEFWLGLRYVREMAYQGQTELRLDLTAADGTDAYETFQNFYLDSSVYTLHIDPGTGTAGDNDLYGLLNHNGQRFTTHDVDRDSHLTVNCANVERGGWWYNDCGDVNLNGD